MEKSSEVLKFTSKQHESRVAVDSRFQEISNALKIST